MQHTKSFLPALLLVLFFSACKKEESLQPNNLTPTTPTATTSPEDKLKDSTLLYTKDIYLWSDKIPATFNARSYADPAAIMTAIGSMLRSPDLPSSVDRWSFAMKQHGVGQYLLRCF
jgi:hypothetical protein